MPSLQSRLFLFLLRNRHLFRFHLRGTRMDESIPIETLRQNVEKPNRLFGKLPSSIEVAPVQINGLSAEWLFSTSAPKDNAILYFHGGGYAIGSCRSHRPIVAKFVKGTGIGAFLFDYRLAPEHPFPAALEDAIVAYRYLLTQGLSPKNIVFVGDSAGGGLCLATLLALRDQGMPLPAGAVALSPWTDLACTGNSYRTNAKTCLSPEGSWFMFSKYYVGDNDPQFPLISPLYGDLYGLPPLLLFVGGDEILRDDSIRFAEKAKAAGVEVDLEVGEGLFHCYPACAPLFPEARKAMDKIGVFIRSRLKCL